MAIILTGGTGKTSIRIARLLQDANLAFLVASRKGASAATAGMRAVKFDWLDYSTFKNPFEVERGISAIYLVAPEIDEPSVPMNAFIDYAVKEHGVKRFVLLAGGTAEPGNRHVGKVWLHMLEIGCDYTVLRPSWFMENFSEGWHQASINQQGKIYTACGDGRIPFCSAEDIASVAFRALIDEKPHNTDYRILGPELLTHDQVAEKLSRGIGRHIENVKLTREQRKDALLKAGVAQPVAELIASLETMAATGVEEKVANDVEKVTGNSPLSFDAFVQKNKSAWEKIDG